MRELNLGTKTDEEKLVLEFLKNNVTQELAEKINNGYKVVEDNKEVIKKKTLSGFMNYAKEQARESANGKNYAMIKDDVVFSWAITYFEEDSIPENYVAKIAAPIKTVSVKETIEKTVKKKDKVANGEMQQMSLFGE